LIGLAGKAGSGKDFIADMLIRYADGAGLEATKVPFALGVRQEIEDELGVSIPRLYEKPTPPTVRRLLQWYGTDYRRAENPDHWVERGIFVAGKTNCDLVIFPDVRFQNEVDAIRNLHGKVALVTAPEHVREARIGVVPRHSTEDAVFLDIDYTVVNDGDAPLIDYGLIDYAGGVDYESN
jgi:hypothetical protein